MTTLDQHKQPETKQINGQTPGPLVPGSFSDPLHPHGMKIHLTSEDGDGCVVANMEHNNADRLQTVIADAALIAASYTVFDKAGRSLGVDAAELAESIDLASLIYSARSVLEDVLNGKTRSKPSAVFSVNLLRAQLSKLPKV